jgi:hypothetical protein
MATSSSHEEDDYTAEDNKTLDSNINFDLDAPTRAGQFLTVTELLDELHIRYEHIVFFGKKKNLVTNTDADNTMIYMSIGDVHCLLGMLEEVKDSLKDNLAERRFYVDDFYGEEDDGEDYGAGDHANIR